jgi:hypothetical protein
MIVVDNALSRVDAAMQPYLVGYRVRGTVPLGLTKRVTYGAGARRPAVPG